MIVDYQPGHEAWIDVGGTFTDCYVRFPDGQRRRTKVLSSGRVLISVGSGSRGAELWAAELQADPDDFWVGAVVRLSVPEQVSSGPPREARVLRSQGGTLTLDSPILDGSTGWRAELDAGVEAPVLATRRLLGLGVGQSLPPLRVRLGTTKGTNALLTRRGARTALAITAPFEDLLLIGDQTRPDLFALAIERPPPLAELTVGIHERLDAQGQVLQPLDAEQARNQLRAARMAGCESLAICLLHAYVNPAHEQLLREVAQQVGFEHISCSSQLAPLIEIVPRAQTAVVDAYLSPIIHVYLQRLVAQFGGTSSVDLLVMTSGGGLVKWHEYSGKDSILSGPAGGVAALRHLAGELRTSRPEQPPLELIGLDMGGTSTDVCRVAEEQHLQYESTKAGVRIFTPTLPIETVAAGGGSVCWFDGVSLRVGPHSAGADPGPACYGRQGPLTITDLNVFLRRIPACQFPFPIDHRAIEQRLGEILQQSQVVLGTQTLAELAAGFRRIANEQMAEAVRTVSLAQGVDVRDHALIGFGGAAGQHICEIADLLDIGQVIDSAEAGLLSALGMGLAERRLTGVVSIYQLLDEVAWDAVAARVQNATEELLDQFQQQGVAEEALRAERRLEVRYVKTEATLTLPWPHTPVSAQVLAAEFAALHRQRFGYSRSLETPLEIVAARLEVIARGTGNDGSRPTIHATGQANLATSQHQPTLAPPSPTPAVDEPWQQIPRTALLPDQQISGPAVVLNEGSTLVIDRGWQATCTQEGLLRVTRQTLTTEPRSGPAQLALDSHASHRPTSHFDPVYRDCFAQRLSAIATQMGIVLQQTAVSVNVKQRRDFSCAVFDGLGRLLANAPHVPVHLGAMGETVRAVLAQFPQTAPGDNFITNDPYRGGSHLPDVTVVTPVFDSPQAERPVFFVANRAHHADIGGVAPGSMSVAAKRLGEEGAIIPPLRLTAAHVDQSETLVQLLCKCPYPPRNIDENLADIAAQLAANARGVELLAAFASTTTWENLQRYALHVLDAAEMRVRNFLAAQAITPRTFSDCLDDGTLIQVSLGWQPSGALLVDFGGSGPTSSANFNANRSIVTAAILYVLRCWIADDLPLNEGIMRCIELRIEPGILNPTPASSPEDSPAVAAGNVETSQRVVDVLLGALGLAAASQGTMNNLLFGNQRFGFYETICGGAGATVGHSGASGVHTHMTNTRLTDPEVLEARYPVRLEHFGLRSDSGGSGRWSGGNGVVRRLKFLEPVELSLLTSRRGPYAPFGLAGGQPGSLGYNTLIKRDGTRVALPNCCQIQIEAEEQLEIQTPGGGGFGVVGHNSRTERGTTGS